MVSLRAHVIDDTFSSIGRVQQKERVNRIYESARTFLANYFADENGRCEKLPNPRGSRDEYRLPLWLNKSALYRIYKADQDAMGSESPTSKFAHTHYERFHSLSLFVNEKRTVFFMISMAEFIFEPGVPTTT